MSQKRLVLAAGLADRHQPLEETAVCKPEKEVQKPQREQNSCSKHLGMLGSLS